MLLKEHFFFDLISFNLVYLFLLNKNRMFVDTGQTGCASHFENEGDSGNNYNEIFTFEGSEVLKKTVSSSKDTPHERGGLTVGGALGYLVAQRF